MTRLITPLSDPPAIRGIFRTDERARAAYAEGAGIYRIIPAAVALPVDAEDLATILQWARDHRVSVVPRGAGSAMGGGNVGSGVLLDLTTLGAGRLDVEPDRSVAVTGTAVPYKNLAHAAARHGLRLPPDPSSGRWATLGGMAATNAAGARSVRHGSVRPWVRAIELMTADGVPGWIRRSNNGAEERQEEPALPALMRFRKQVAPSIAVAAATIRTRFPHTRKNSAGYALDAYLDSGDVIDLIIGSEGTLGIITAIEWQLDRTPAHRAGIGVALAELDTLADIVLALRQLNASAIELLDRTFLDLVASTAESKDAARRIPAGAAGLLLVEFEHDDPTALRGVVGDAVRAVTPLAADVETALTEDEIAQLWALRHAASPILARLPEHRRSLQVIEDGCVPVPQLGRYVQAVRRAAATHGLEVVLFGHAGDGHLHANLLVDLSRGDWEGAVATLLEEVTAQVIRLGGTPAGEHGAGRLRAGLLQQLYGPEIISLFHAIKHAFDPNGTLNPGVLLPGRVEPIDQLKVGSRAVSLPDDIARELRHIEREGEYDRPRLSLADGNLRL
ncbi:MAG: FAD-binding oxidoreductase [Gemmatimonadales bacterium]|nr:FAD-binding oxidoreductase [Gemmatimonadales bacterium]